MENDRVRNTENIPEEKSDFFIGGQEFDLLTSPEVEWKANFALLVISGLPGTGTSSLARSLRDKFNAELFTAGDLIRMYSKTDKRAPGFIQRDPSVDADIDEQVRQKVRNADRNRPRIIEAQIGSLTALDEQRDLEQKGIYLDNAPIIRILLWAKKEVRIRRLTEAARAKGEYISIRQIHGNTSERERGDLDYWKKLYPDLIGEDDPLRRGAKDAYGNPICNIEIDNTDDIGPEQTFRAVHLELMRMGLVSPLKITKPSGDGIAME